jgi:hypothetical protein
LLQQQQQRFRVQSTIKRCPFNEKRIINDQLW